MAIAAGLVYPLVVYLGRSAIPASVFIAVAIAIVIARALLMNSPQMRRWRLPLLLTVPVILALAVYSPMLAVKAYPVVVSLAAATVFGASLFSPPSLIERFARLSEPNLPPEGQAYCRTVTVVWAIWLLVNAVIAGALALSPWEEAWALWTGLVAYIIMGMLGAGELLIRQNMRRRSVAA